VLNENHTSTVWQYPAIMQAKEIATKDVVAKNLAALMKANGDMSQKRLAELSGVSQRHISSLLSGSHKAPGIDKLDQIAKVFRLKGWHLQIPNVPTEVLDSIDTVVKALADHHNSKRPTPLR
jgi:transcriptional regulator with XRE-family HTH domain